LSGCGNSQNGALSSDATAPHFHICRLSSAAIKQTLDGISTIHADDMATLMTLNFQQFENVALTAA